MTIATLAHADSLERLALTGEFDAWLDATAPTPEEQDTILHDMHVEDTARREREENTEFSMPTLEEWVKW